ncbi:MAG: thioredoxin [Victivallales bacterium]|nr:thioredoxin [Victivallales bacterium]MCF7888489.1 thioredoxin [Victivallales bacterium]
MSNAIELNQENFESQTSSGVTLVDFWAPWCGPCKMLTPVLDQVAAEIGDKAKIAKVNVDDCPQLAQQFGIRNIPALFLIKDGQTVEQFIGMQDKKTLTNAINSAL